jgi:hypothetical protein
VASEKIGFPESIRGGSVPVASAGDDAGDDAGKGLLGKLFGRKKE